MFSKIYKSAVDDLKPNENLKHELLIEAEKTTKEKHIIRPLYRYLPAAAAVIVLAVSLRSAPELVKMINPSNSESSVIQSVSNTEKVNDVISETEGISNDFVVTPVETESPTVMPTTTPEVQKNQNNSANAKKTKRPESKSAVKATLPKKDNTDESTAKPESDKKVVVADTTERPAETKAMTKKAHAVDLAEDAKVDGTSSEENISVATLSDTDIQTAVYDVDNENAGGGGGGSSGGAGVKMRAAAIQELWSIKDYSEYIGFDIQSKIIIPEGFSDKTESERYFETDDSGTPLNDEWIYHYTNDDKYISVITTKRNINYSGEALNVLGVTVYADGNVYSFSYKGVNLNVLYSNVEKETVIEVIKSLIN